MIQGDLTTFDECVKSSLSKMGQFVEMLEVHVSHIFKVSLCDFDFGSNVEKT